MHIPMPQIKPNECKPLFPDLFFRSFLDNSGTISTLKNH